MTYPCLTCPIKEKMTNSDYLNCVCDVLTEWEEKNNFFKINKSKYLCLENCIHAEKKIVESEISLHLPPFIGKYGKVYPRLFKCKCLSINCSFHGKYVRKYVTQCKGFQNSNLSCFGVEPKIISKKPQWLERTLEPFDNSCKACKGKGFSIVKAYKKQYGLDGNVKPFYLYYREVCGFCNGKGIVRGKDLIAQTPF